MKGFIFDLDGVIVSTDGLHYRAWKQMADNEGIYFDEKINNRLRGVSRMASLEIVLERSDREYSDDEKLALATYKNDLYKELLKSLTPDDILPGVSEVLKELRTRGYKLAIGSSSRNTPAILKYIGLEGFFDAVFAEIGEYAKDEVLIVGDSLTSDIQGGVNAGIKTCWFNPKSAENTSALKPDYEIRDIGEVLEIVK